MTGLRIYLDDERKTPENENWVRCYHVWEVITLLEKREPIEVMSLDHDLGSGEPTGYEVIQWLEQKVATDPTFVPPEHIIVHSANPVGKERMKAGIYQIYKMVNERNS